MQHDRRETLRLTGLALSGSLAGCTGGDEGTPADTAIDTPTGTPTETPADADTPTPGATETATRTETPTPTATPTPEPLRGTKLVVDNVSVTAWKVLDDESGTVAPTGENNPTLTFEVGTRYVVENRGWDAHPFALRAEDGSGLLSQGGDGRFEGDAAVGWIDRGEELAFTVTSDLAADLDYYICTAHSPMRGDVRVD